MREKEGEREREERRDMAGSRRYGASRDMLESTLFFFPPKPFFHSLPPRNASGNDDGVARLSRSVADRGREREKRGQPKRRCEEEGL